jgi:hypothetical protein
MGGRVWVDSEYKKGSTFSIELARISHGEAQRLIEAGSQKSGSIGRAIATVPVARAAPPAAPVQATAAMPTVAAPTLITPERTKLPIETPAPTQDMSDPLIGAVAAIATPATPPLAHSAIPTVLPAEWQEKIAKAKAANAAATPIPEAPTSPASVTEQKA